MKALIFGVTGQVGSYMAELLTQKEYTIYGVARRSSSNNLGRINNMLNAGNFLLLNGDVTDGGCVNKIIKDVQPHEIYNFAAQSHVHISFTEPKSTFDSVTEGCLNCLEAIRNYSPESKYFYAASSEMFGQECDPDGFQRETTKMVPNSPYAAAKLAAFNLTRIYRASYNLFSCSGIAFNMESPRRGENFVTKKITKYVAALNKAIQNGEEYPKLKLGNINAKRDWSFAGDSVLGFWQMMQQSVPEDFVFSSMETHSVIEFLDLAFSYIKLDWQKWVDFDESLLRPMEVPYLNGDSSKARNKLGWCPKVNFDKLVRLMMYEEIRCC